MQTKLPLDPIGACHVFAERFSLRKVIVAPADSRQQLVDVPLLPYGPRAVIVNDQMALSTQSSHLEPSFMGFPHYFSMVFYPSRIFKASMFIMSTVPTDAHCPSVSPRLWVQHMAMWPAPTPVDVARLVHPSCGRFAASICLRKVAGTEGEGTQATSCVRRPKNQ